MYYLQRNYPLALTPMGELFGLGEEYEYDNQYVPEKKPPRPTVVSVLSPKKPTTSVWVDPNPYFSKGAVSSTGSGNVVVRPPTPVPVAPPQPPPPPPVTSAWTPPTFNPSNPEGKMVAPVVIVKSATLPPAPSPPVAGPTASSPKIDIGAVVKSVITPPSQSSSSSSSGSSTPPPSPPRRLNPPPSSLRQPVFSISRRTAQAPMSRIPSLDVGGFIRSGTAGAAATAKSMGGGSGSPQIDNIESLLNRYDFNDTSITEFHSDRLDDPSNIRLSKKQFDGFKNVDDFAHQSISALLALKGISGSPKSKGWQKSIKDAYGTRMESLIQAALSGKKTEGERYLAARDLKDQMSAIPKLAKMVKYGKSAAGAVSEVPSSIASTADSVVDFIDSGIESIRSSGDYASRVGKTAKQMFVDDPLKSARQRAIGLVINTAASSIAKSASSFIGSSIKNIFGKKPAPSPPVAGPATSSPKIDIGAVVKSVITPPSQSSSSSSSGSSTPPPSSLRQPVLSISRRTAQAPMSRIPSLDVGGFIRSGTSGDAATAKSMVGSSSASSIPTDSDAKKIGLSYSNKALKYIADAYARKKTADAISAFKISHADVLATKKTWDNGESEYTSSSGDRLISQMMNKVSSASGEEASGSETEKYIKKRVDEGLKRDMPKVFKDKWFPAFKHLGAIMSSRDLSQEEREEKLLSAAQFVNDYIDGELKLAINKYSAEAMQEIADANKPGPNAVVDEFSSGIRSILGNKTEPSPPSQIQSGDDIPRKNIVVEGVREIARSVARRLEEELPHAAALEAKRNAIAAAEEAKRNAITAARENFNKYDLQPGEWLQRRPATTFSSALEERMADRRNAIAEAQYKFGRYGVSPDREWREKEPGEVTTFDIMMAERMTAERDARLMAQQLELNKDEIAQGRQLRGFGVY